MVCLDSIVRVLLGVVERARQELIDDGDERPGPVGHDLGRLAMVAERRREEPARSLESRRGDTKRSMIWPYWSTARYT